MCHDITYITTEIEAEYEWETGSTNDTPYLTLRSELWGVLREEFG